jgi:hypothetical protein
MFLGLVGHKLTAVRRNAKENCRASAMLQKKVIFIQAAFFCDLYYLSSATFKTLGQVATMDLLSRALVMVL